MYGMYRDVYHIAIKCIITALVSTPQPRYAASADETYCCGQPAVAMEMNDS